MSVYKVLNEEELPAGWEIRLLSEIAGFRLGKTPEKKKKKYWDTEQ